MNEIRNKVWLGSLDADMNSRYFGHLRADYRRYDMVTKIFLAIMSSGTVGAWMIWQDAEKYPVGVLLWKILSGASALIAIVLPIVDFGKKLDAASRLRTEWGSIKNEYDVLWMRLESEKPTPAWALACVENIIKNEAALSELESDLPVGNHELTRKCQQEVRVARNIK